MIPDHVEQKGKLLNIVVTGTPGVGKTSFSLLLTDQLNTVLKSYQINNMSFNYINIGKLINEKHLYKDWNKEFDVPEFDDDMVCDELEPSINQGGEILDFHSPGFITEDWVYLVVLLRCNNTILYDRLKARGYSDKKITENIDCEIMEVTADDVKESFGAEKIIELKSEENTDMEKNIETVIKTIENMGFMKKNNNN